MTSNCDHGCGNNDDHDGKGDDLSDCTYPDLTTDRLILRPLTSKDAVTLARLCNNLQIAQMTSTIPYPYTLDDAKTWIEKTTRARQNGHHVYAITNLHDAGILGTVGAGPVATHEYVLGYWVGEPFWNNGYATEAVHALLDHLFMEHGATIIRAGVRVINQPSKQVLRKCGFQPAGSCMIDSLGTGHKVAAENFRLERTIWQSLKGWV